MKQRYEHQSDIPYNPLGDKWLPGSMEDHEYLIDRQKYGWELCGPPVNRNAGTVQEDVWAYYWKRKITEE